MEQRGDGTAVRVGGSGLVLGDVCRALISKMGHINWIRSGRIGIRDGQEGRALDIVHAEGYMEGREVGMDDALHKTNLHLVEAARINRETALNMQYMQSNNDKEHKKLMSDLRMLHDSSKKLQAGTRCVTNWFDSHTKSFENIVTQLTYMYLRKVYRISHNASKHVYELESTRHTIPNIPPHFEKGVEWDGVLYVPEARHLFLIEAKSALKSTHIKDMKDRMDRTVVFINLCQAGKLSTLPRQAAAAAVDPPQSDFEFKELCNSWASFGVATQVFGVIGGLGFTQEMLKIADKNGLLLVMPRDGLYDISLGESHRLISVTPPADDSSASKADDHPLDLSPMTISQQEVNDADDADDAD